MTIAELEPCEHAGTPCPIKNVNSETSCECSCYSCAEVRYWDNFRVTCQTCGGESECKEDCDEAAYDRWLDERVARLGPNLAMLPDFMECYQCGREHLMVMTDSYGLKFVMRRPVGLGPIAEPNRDPTQTYKLECGHLAM